MVLGDFRIEELAAQRFEALERAFPRSPLSAASSPPHRRRGSRRDGGSGSFRLANRQVQAREIQLAVLGIRKELALGTTTGVMARCRPTISRASSSRPMCT